MHKLFYFSVGMPLTAMLIVFSGSVSAEQNIATLYSAAGSEVRHVSSWLVDSSHSICNGNLNFENAAKLDRRRLNQDLEARLASNFLSAESKKKMSKTYGKRIADSASLLYFVDCDAPAPNDQLKLLLEP